LAAPRKKPLRHQKWHRLLLPRLLLLLLLLLKWHLPLHLLTLLLLLPRLLLLLLATKLYAFRRKSRLTSRLFYVRRKHPCLLDNFPATEPNSRPGSTDSHTLHFALKDPATPRKHPASKQTAAQPSQRQTTSTYEIFW